MGVKSMLERAAGNKSETKWDKFNSEAHVFFDRLISRGFITRVETRNYVEGKMNCFFAFMSSNVSKDYDIQRAICRDFMDLWSDYGITMDDMIYDSQMGIRLTTEDRFEGDERRISQWVDMI